MKSQKVALSLVVLILGCYAFGQNTTQENPVSIEKESSIHRNVQQHTDAIFDRLIKLRRDFHRDPEVSEQEKRTSKKIAKYLESLGLEVKTNIGGYGVVGILNGYKKGKRIAWRADIDAIATNIPDVVDFQSKNEGVRHICGHDVHTTVGLGIADVLSNLKESLKGTVYFVFQPAEENFKGAEAMITDGLFDIINPDEIYGLHISPSPSGVIATKSENIYAHRLKIEVVYKNATNQDAAIQFTKKLISELQTYDPKSEFWDEKNLLNPKLGIENPNTIYKDYIAVRSNFKINQSDTEFKISVGIDASNMDRLNAFLESLKKEIKHSTYSKDLLSVESSFALGVNKSPMNDEVLTNETMKSIASIYGKQKVIPMFGVAPGSFGDDFTFFQKHTPGVYFFLGGSNYEKGIISMPHSPNFVVDEECIRTGVNFFSSMVIERLYN